MVHQDERPASDTLAGLFLRCVRRKGLRMVHHPLRGGLVLRRGAACIRLAGTGR